jgi:histo-blood group ABO system transferase
VIGLGLIATGKYDVFLGPFIESVNKFFMTGHEVSVVVFSDKDLNIESTDRVKIKVIKIEHKPFPYASLLRYKHFDDNAESFDDCTHVFYSDVDMLFVDHVGEEILNIGLTCTLHPGFYKGGWGSQNVDKRSNAYLPKQYWNNYCAGGFQGGAKDEFLSACQVLNIRISVDENNGVLAEWHDESHWNWYLKTHIVNILMLSSAYCYPEAEWFTRLQHNFKPKLVALEKNHKKIRS